MKTIFVRKADTEVTEANVIESEKFFRGLSQVKHTTTEFERGWEIIVSNKNYNYFNKLNEDMKKIK